MCMQCSGMCKKCTREFIDNRLKKCATLFANLGTDSTEEEIKDRLQAAYKANATIRIIDDYPDIRTVVNTHNSVIGGIHVNAETGQLAMVSVLDNLLKGAASQCFENIKIASGN